MQESDCLLLDGEEHYPEEIPALPKNDPRIPTGRAALLLRFAIDLATRLQAEATGSMLVGPEKPEGFSPELEAELLLAIRAAGSAPDEPRDLLESRSDPGPRSLEISEKAANPRQNDTNHDEMGSSAHSTVTELLDAIRAAARAPTKPHEHRRPSSEVRSRLERPALTPADFRQRGAIHVAIERALSSAVQDMNRVLDPASSQQSSSWFSEISDEYDPLLQASPRQCRLRQYEDELKMLRTKYLAAEKPGAATTFEPVTRAELAAETARVLRFAPYRFRVDGIRTSCYRGYVATWEIREDRILLVRIDGHPSCYPDEPIFADWLSGGLIVPRGEVVVRVSDYLTIHSSYTLFRIARGRVESIETVSARERFPDLGKFPRIKDPDDPEPAS